MCIHVKIEPWKLLQLEGKIGKFTIIVGGFSTPLSFIIGRPRQHKIIKDIDNWKNPINYDLIDIYHTVNPSWEIDGETVSDFILGGSKITTDGDCSHEIKRRLLLGRKVMTNLDSILKSRDITLPTKVCLVKAMVFPVVMYGCESWTVKKAEHWRIDAFELWCWWRLLRVPWTARKSN